MPTSVGIVHDYLTQRGGAERVVLSLLSAFPDAELHTSLYNASSTFPEFEAARIHVSHLNHSRLLRQRHRLALPLLASTFSAMTVHHDVTICSSSGWAHGVRTSGRKIVYCYTPARWLYQPTTYLGCRAEVAPRVALTLFGPHLRSWDLRAARTAHRYLTSSTEVMRRIQRLYRQDAEVLPPPPLVRLNHPRHQVDGVHAGYWLCVSRLLPYKNVDAVITAFDDLVGEQLVVAGTGPQEHALRSTAGKNVRMVGDVNDNELCWLYANCRGLVSASHEDFGLTPLEAAIFGKPSVVLGRGGFVDTVVEELSGIFFSQPTPQAISNAIRRAGKTSWCPEAIQEYARRFDQDRFKQRIQEVVKEEACCDTEGVHP